MFWWVASGPTLLGAQRAEVQSLLDRLRPSLAYLGDVRRPSGAAALVDADRRLFLAHTDAVQGDTVQAKVGDWRVSLRVLGDDPRTGLVILGLRGDAPPELGPALVVADLDPLPGTKVCVILAEGGIVGTFVGGQRIVISDKKPAVPVSEIRFETPQQLVGGSLVVSFDGRLLGAMGATVARPDNVSSITRNELDNLKRGLARNVLPRQSFLPGGLTVAYTPTLSLVRRSVNGLISDGHHTDYAALGIQVGDAPGGGAIIRRVIADSPAGRSGVRVNDVLLAMGDRSIERQYDFLQALMAFRPGERIALRLRRDGTEASVEVVLAKSRS